MTPTIWFVRVVIDNASCSGRDWNKQGCEGEGGIELGWSWLWYEMDGSLFLAVGGGREGGNACMITMFVSFISLAM